MLIKILCLAVAILVASADEDVCKLPSSTGPCRALYKRWFFDSLQGNCKSFNYGGCQGNGNRFNTKEECEQVCLNKTDANINNLTESPINSSDTTAELPCA